MCVLKVPVLKAWSLGGSSGGGVWWEEVRSHVLTVMIFCLGSVPNNGTTCLRTEAPQNARHNHISCDGVIDCIRSFTTEIIR